MVFEQLRILQWVTTSSKELVYITEKLLLLCRDIAEGLTDKTKHSHYLKDYCKLIPGAVITPDQNGQGA